MSWARRPEDETPRMVQREFRDGRGRLWVGSISSGTLAGGEEHAEAIFVCLDQPSELKRVARLGFPAAGAGEKWLEMDEREILEAFRVSEEA